MISVGYAREIIAIIVAIKKSLAKSSEVLHITRKNYLKLEERQKQK